MLRLERPMDWEPRNLFPMAADGDTRQSNMQLVRWLLLRCHHESLGPRASGQIESEVDFAAPIGPAQPLDTSIDRHHAPPLELPLGRRNSRVLHERFLRAGDNRLLAVADYSNSRFSFLGDTHRDEGEGSGANRNARGDMCLSRPTRDEP